MEEQSQLVGEKRDKMSDTSSFLPIGGMQKCSKLTEAVVHNHQNKEEETSQYTNTPVSSHSDKPSSGACLSLGLFSSIQSSTNLIKSDKELHAHKMTCTNLNLDLNYNPFPAGKNFRPTDASECSSTNDFLSSTHGGIPIPKQRGRPSKRKKEDELKKKIDIKNREHPNKYTKNAAPIGLLSGLDPGIIRHVRNKKQVNSIIEAVVQSQRSDTQMANMNKNQIASEIEDVTSHNSVGDQFGLYYKPLFSGSDQEGSTLPRFDPENDDDSLTLKLSSAVSMGSENASSMPNDELPADYDTIASLSLKGASVASQWLDLLQQDIKGRLAALKRSKKRVMNVVQTELPYLLSVESSSDQDKDGYFEHSSENGCSNKASLDVHMARWKSVFSQMDRALYDEGKHLENWLKQVQDMQSHCDGGLKYFGASRTMLLAEEFSGLKKAESIERENAVRAAAASVYSTSNLIMSKETCF